MLTIVDYGMGNLGSVANMVRKIGARSRISSRPEDILDATALILPGVGHFDTAMRNLRERGLDTPLASQVLDRETPVLGICLGMQLFARRSEEGSEPGLGWIAADVVRFNFPGAEKLPVPHMGWNEVEGQGLLFKDLPPEQSRFYFVHSYHLVADVATDVAAWCTYGERFAAAVARGRIFGVQFHPEKSHRHGMVLLRNFVEAIGRAP